LFLQCLSQEVDVLLPLNNQSSFTTREVEEHVYFPTPLPNSPPSDLFSVAHGFSDICENSSDQGFDAEKVTRASSSSLSSVSDITITDSEQGDAKFRSNGVLSSDYTESLADSMPTLICKCDKFYFEDGNVSIVCEGILFRAHTSVLCFNSPVFRELLSFQNLALANRFNGSPCIHLSDSEEDFSTLLKVLYDPGFLGRRKTPNFPIYSAILRMTTKYKIPSVRDQLLVDLDEAYPTAFEAYEASSVLGESVFGNPIPHPNAVLKLFVLCGVKFALPYAFYRACQPGISSLMDTTLESALLPEVLKDAIMGLGKLKEIEWNAAKTILFGPKLKKCDKFFCFRAQSLYYERNGLPIFQTALNSIICTSADMATRVLEPPHFVASSEEAFCKACRDSWLASHRETREKVWKSLPTIFSLDPLETMNKVQ